MPRLGLITILALAGLLWVKGQATAGHGGGGGHALYHGGYRGHGYGYRGYGYRGYGGYGYGFGYYPFYLGGYGYGYGLGGGYGYGFGAGYPGPYGPGYGYPVGYGPPYPPPPVAGPPPLYAPPLPSPAPAPSNRCHIHVVLPANATLWFGDEATSRSGAVRDFLSPEMVPGKTYTYTLKARWVQDGQTVEQARDIRVRANEMTTVSFGAPSH